MIITIDGPAGTGKSTTAKLLAEKIGFVYYDTGAVYRSLTWYLLENNIDIDDEGQIKKAMDAFSFDLQADKEGNKSYFVGKVDVTKAIRSDRITKIVSKVSAIACIRESLRPLQKSFAKDKNVVFEGRDMGTAIFPDADMKFFLTAKPEVRAQRRLLQAKEQFPDQKWNEENILNDIQKRDGIDSSRKASPLKCAEDAIVVDTSLMTMTQVVDQLICFWEDLLSGRQ